MVRVQDRTAADASDPSIDKDTSGKVSGHGSGSNRSAASWIWAALSRADAIVGEPGEGFRVGMEM